jgi:prepilin peptidase CpaA
VLEYPILLIFPIAMIYAAGMDLLTMTIPNRISLALIIGFFAAALLGGLGWSEIGKHVGVGVGVLAVTIVMFSLGWMGGGDAKLLAAASLWFGLDQVLDYVILVALFGGLLMVLIITYRSFIPPVIIAGRDWAERLHDKKCGVPYGIALAAAGLWIYPNSQIFQAFAA